MRCHDNFAHAQQKENQTQAELVFSSETDRHKNNIEEGGERGNVGSACRIVRALKRYLNEKNLIHGRVKATISKFSTWIFETYFKMCCIGNIYSSYWNPAITHQWLVAIL